MMVLDKSSIIVYYNIVTYYKCSNTKDIMSAETAVERRCIQWQTIRQLDISD